MGWLIFFGVVAAYLTVGARRLPVYYRRWYDHSRKEWHTIRTVEESQKEAFWTALGVALFWPYYEAGVWFRDSVIHALTAEERAKAEFENAKRIVDEYTKRKEREDREAFDRHLRGDA
jgi:hypothetical protein